MSYGFGDEYGNDQIHVGFEDIREHLSPFDVNRPGGVKSINTRETRLRKKIQQYTPSCERKQELAKEAPNFFTQDGMYETHRRQAIRDNIEFKYFGSREVRNGPTCKGKERFNNDEPQIEPSDNCQKMYQELLELEKKNNILVMFVFFLAIVVLVQYSKLNNDPRSLQFLVMPNSDGRTATPAVAAQP